MLGFFVLIAVILLGSYWTYLSFRYKQPFARVFTRKIMLSFENVFMTLLALVSVAGAANASMVHAEGVELGLPEVRFVGHLAVEAIGFIFNLILLFLLVRLFSLLQNRKWVSSSFMFIAFFLAFVFAVWCPYINLELMAANLKETFYLKLYWWKLFNPQASNSDLYTILQNNGMVSADGRIVLLDRITTVTRFEPSEILSPAVLMQIKLSIFHWGLTFFLGVITMASEIGRLHLRLEIDHLDAKEQQQVDDLRKKNRELEKEALKNAKELEQEDKDDKNKKKDKQKDKEKNEEQDEEQEQQEEEEKMEGEKRAEENLTRNIQEVLHFVGYRARDQAERMTTVVEDKLDRVVALDARSSIILRLNNLYHSMKTLQDKDIIQNRQDIEKKFRAEFTKVFNNAPESREPGLGLNYKIHSKVLGPIKDNSSGGRNRGKRR